MKLLTPSMLLLIAAPLSAQGPAVAPGWPVTVPGASVNGGLLVNLDADPQLELIFASGTAGGLGFLHAYEPDGTIVPGWPAVGQNGTFAAPAFGDIDGDGVGEVVATEFFFGINGRLVAFEADGSPVAGFPVNIGGPLKNPALADLDGDGDLEILVTFNNGGFGSLYALQGDGSVMPGWPQVFDDVQSTAPSVGDMDGDGIPEIFAASFQSLYGFAPDGSLLPGFPFTPSGQFFNYNSITLADMDGDGERELVTATSDQFVDQPGAVWVLGNDGSVAAGWPKATSTAIWAPPAVADLDGNGVMDVIIGDQLLSAVPVNRMYAWDASGSPLAGFPVTGLDAVTNQVSIADVDGDQQLEILYETNVNGQGYYALNHDGTAVAGWPIDGAAGTVSSSFNAQLSVADVDLDGMLDIAGTLGRVNDGESDIFLWNTTSPADPILAPVSTHMYGPTRSGVVEPLEDLGTNYCVNAPNSTGFPASISARGSDNVAVNILDLSATPVPDQPGLFYYGPTQALTPFGDGFRCVAGQVGRLPITTATGSVLEWRVDLTAPPSSATQITAGSTWNFQAWYRDPAAGMSGFNLSDGLEITFQP